MPVIDLHKYAADLIKKNGKEASRVYFHPGDMTHTNEYGSFLFAHFIARELSKLDPLTFAIDVQDEEDSHQMSIQPFDRNKHGSRESG